MYLNEVEMREFYDGYKMQLIYVDNVGKIDAIYEIVLGIINQ
jgi:hypothetical protein